MKNVCKQVHGQIRERLQTLLWWQFLTVWETVFNQVWNQVRDPVYEQTWERAAEQVWWQVYELLKREGMQ